MLDFKNTKTEVLSSFHCAPGAGVLRSRNVGMSGVSLFPLVTAEDPHSTSDYKPSSAWQPWRTRCFVAAKIFL